MSAWFAGGGVFALIVAVMGLEAAALALYHRRTGRGIAPARLIGDIGAGMCLSLGALLILSGVPWPFAGAALLAALGAHVFDVVQRWNR